MSSHVAYISAVKIVVASCRCARGMAWRTRWSSQRLFRKKDVWCVKYLPYLDTIMLRGFSTTTISRVRCLASRVIPVVVVDALLLVFYASCALPAGGDTSAQKCCNSVGYAPRRRRVVLPPRVSCLRQRRGRNQPPPGGLQPRRKQTRSPCAR